MKSMWNKIANLWTQIRYRKMLKTASVSVEHVLPTATQVRYCHVVVAQYDSKTISPTCRQELGDKIEAKRRELGRDTSKK